MKQAFNLNDYIEDIELNSLKGRMIHAPARSTKAKNTNILFVHGHHSSLERMRGVADLMMDYGNFCLPDMPGFGGMDHLYSIGEKPSIESLADYMAAFIKLKYGSKKKFIVVGYSMGFLVVTRMLQKYPALRKQVTEVVSLAGLLHKDDLKFTKKRRFFYLASAKILGTRLASFVTREIFLRKWFLGTIYTRSHNAKNKFDGLTTEDLKKMINFEVGLWRMNHIPTWTYTSTEMLTSDLVSDVEQMTIPLIAVTIDADNYFDNATVEQHLRIAYSDVKMMKASSSKHGGSMVETASDAMPFFPKALRKHLKSLR